MQRAMQNMLSRVGRAPAFRPPAARKFSDVPGKEQMNAAAARAGDETANRHGDLGASLGENVQKRLWRASAKVSASAPAPSVFPLAHTRVSVPIIDVTQRYHEYHDRPDSARRCAPSPGP